MKKIFFTMVAIAAMAACTKSEVQYEQQQEIGFAPVTKKTTKSAEADTEYNIALPMYIFANTYADGTPTSFTVPYFANAKFTNRENKIFGGADASYYWPNVKTLVFSGLSKSGNVNIDNSETEAVEGSVPVYSDNHIVLEGYAPGYGANEQGDNDLMWFSTTSPYAKQQNAIEVTMKHACAWVTLNFKGDDITGAAVNPWTITNVSFAGLSQSGNVVLGETAAWTIDTATPCEVFSGSEALTEQNKDFTKTYGNFKDLVVVPQAAQTLSVSYTYESDPNNHIEFTETKVIPLTFGADNIWNAGVHYTYNITITTSEILVEPKVAAWDPNVVTNVEF